MVTIKEIAEAAKVGKSTVSYVLNGQAQQMRIAEKTRLKVEEIAAHMGYQVDEMARGIKTGRTRVIGLISNGVPYELIRGFNMAAERDSFLVKTFIIYKLEGKTPAERIDAMADIILRQRLAGVIVHYGNESIYKLIERLEQKNLPHVITSTLGRNYDKASCFYPDDKAGGAAVAKYFLKLGHHDFACIGGGENNYTENLRIEGFAQILRENGKTLKEERIVRAPDGLLRVKKMKKMLSSLKRLPTAVFCATDNEAVNLLTACLSMGLKVPEDISIAGYGNYPFTATVTPTISSVEENHFERGFEACRHLLEMIEHNAPPRNKTFAVKLIERNSCSRANKKT